MEISDPEPVDRWLREVDHTPAFYFDAITQLELTSWSRGRVTLVGVPSVLGSRALARVNSKTLVPGNPWGVRLYDSMPLPDYPALTART